jgi:hypothetical protein
MSVRARALRCKQLFLSELRVLAGGREVIRKTDDGFFGKGVYTALGPALALDYAAQEPVFVCLALPWRQLAAPLLDKGRLCRPSLDSH